MDSRRHHADNPAGLWDQPSHRSNRWVRRSGESMTLHGENAVAFGIALMAVALFIHFHYFWGNIYNQIWFAVLGKIISVIIFIGAMGVLIVRIGVYGHA